MSNVIASIDPERRRLVEAAAWRMHLTEIEAETTEAFEAWLADPQNRAAWVRTEAPWAFMGDHATEPEVMAARRAALGDALDAPRRAERHWGWPRVAAGAVVIGAIVWGGWLWRGMPAHYGTALGERRIIALADGSRVSLDSGSEVSVRYTEAARVLELIRGQARFDVARDVARPFSVRVRDRKIIATGTAFNVDLAGQTVLVTLIEGHVLVVGDNGATIPSQINMPIELHMGEQLAALPAAAPRIARVDVEKTTAWQNGQMMFDNEPLSTVVARVNRYGATQIAIADPKVAELRISGVFNEGDISGFVDTVTHYLPLKATTENGRIELRSKG